MQWFAIFFVFIGCASRFGWRMMWWMSAGKRKKAKPRRGVGVEQAFWGVLKNLSNVKNKEVKLNFIFTGVWGVAP